MNVVSWSGGQPVSVLLNLLVSLWTTRIRCTVLSRKTTVQKLGLILGPVLFLPVLWADLEPGNLVVTRMAAVAVLMAIWWITEAVPLAATALLPLVLFPCSVF